MMTDWEQAVAAAQRIRVVADQLIARPDYAPREIETRLGLLAFADYLEAAETPPPPLRLEALLKIIELGAAAILDGDS